MAQSPNCSMNSEGGSFGRGGPWRSSGREGGPRADELRGEQGPTTQKCPKNKTTFLEHTPDVIQQGSPDQECSESTSWEPQKVLGTLLGRTPGAPGRFATA
eukprot:4190490-Pyramimonas_sp.AAC.1